MARRNQAAGESMKSQVEETKTELEDLKKNQLDITAGQSVNLKYYRIAHTYLDYIFILFIKKDAWYLKDINHEELRKSNL